MFTRFFLSLLVLAFLMALDAWADRADDLIDQRFPQQSPEVVALGALVADSARQEDGATMQRLIERFIAAGASARQINDLILTRRLDHTSYRYLHSLALKKGMAPRLIASRQQWADNLRARRRH